MSAGATAAELAERLRQRDASLWPEGNVAPNRLGWLDAPQRWKGDAEDLRRWAAGIDAKTVVLLGMGGSSLGPEVLRAACGSERLVVLDTTDPATVARVDPDDAFFVVSSKSGTTLEVQALLAHFWEQVPDGARYAAVTDPGTALARLARERGFSRIFENDPAIGGRYSVLSLFGLVPAALLGYDVAALCESALEEDWEGAAEAGLAMAEAALRGQDKLTVVLPPGRFEALGLWIEQLVAESLGKQGTGVVPVPTTEPERGDDRFVVPVDVTEPEQLGQQFMGWEIATAIAGHRLGVDPFDEPNVAESKQRTNDVLASLPLPEVDVARPGDLVDWLKQEAGEGDYVSVQAYLPYGTEAALGSLRRRIRDHLGGAAVTAGYGPRFLHSTGQLHKGGPNSVVAVQLVPSSPTAQVPVPGFGYDFATLIAAQSIGDLGALQAHGRRVLRVALDDPYDLGALAP